MGIKGLTKLLHSIGARKIDRLEMFEGKVFAFDVSSVIMTYKMNGLFRPWRKTFSNLVRALRRQYGIESIFVFDGLPPPEKLDERLKRCERRRMRFELVDRIEQALQRFVPDARHPNLPNESMDIRDVNILIDITSRAQQQQKSRYRYEWQQKASRCKLASASCADDEKSCLCGDATRPIPTKKLIRYDMCKRYAAYMRSRIRTYEEDFEFVERVADEFGIPIRRASGEAEMECVRLVREGFADVAVTKDTDAFACLCPIIVTDVRPNGRVEYVELKDVLAKLDIDEKLFVEMCILCGTDFNAPLRGIDAVTAHRLAKTYGSVENVIESYRDENDAVSAQRDAKRYDYDKIRAIFDCVNTSTSV